MLNDFKSLMTLLQSYLTWIADMSAGANGGICPVPFFRPARDY